jgi:exopolyphosphatase/guanosine-5'-triphosphate,3'-diphosphate pyrophosphatase
MSAKTTPQKLAAIDVGSNAIRLVIAEVDRSGRISVLKKVREAVRLGHDTFTLGRISDNTLAPLTKVFRKFARLMDEHGVVAYRAVATSALREARNSGSIIAQVARDSDIQIDLISGQEEARLVHTAVKDRIDLEDRNVLLVDIGGGSVEVSLAIDGKTRSSQSFPLGTVRLLERLKQSNRSEPEMQDAVAREFTEIRQYLRRQLGAIQIDSVIGTGGNFECMGKLRVALLQKTSIYSMALSELQQIREHLMSMTLKERIRFLRLREDRADVIIPAILITEEIMEESSSDLLQMPHVGLRDGLLGQLAQVSQGREAGAPRRTLTSLTRNDQ